MKHEGLILVIYSFFAGHILDFLPIWIGIY